MLLYYCCTTAVPIAHETSLFQQVAEPGLLGMGIFIDPDSLPEDAGGFAQLMFLTAVYGYILFRFVWVYVGV